MGCNTASRRILAGLLAVGRSTDTRTRRVPICAGSFRLDASRGTNRPPQLQTFVFDNACGVTVVVDGELQWSAYRPSSPICQSVLTRLSGRNEAVNPPRNGSGAISLSLPGTTSLLCPGSLPRLFDHRTPLCTSSPDNADIQLLIHPTIGSTMRAPLHGRADSSGSHLWKTPLERCDDVLRAGCPLLRRPSGSRGRADRAGQCHIRATTACGSRRSTSIFRRRREINHRPGWWGTGAV